jgi:hypothetical protein
MSECCAMQYEVGVVPMALLLNDGHFKSRTCGGVLAALWCLSSAYALDICQPRVQFMDCKRWSTCERLRRASASLQVLFSLHLHHWQVSVELAASCRSLGKESCTALCIYRITNAPSIHVMPGKHLGQWCTAANLRSANL